MLNKLSGIILFTLFFNCFASIATEADFNDDQEREKCYCIVRQKQNDQELTKDFDCNEWQYVPKGTCKAIGGSTVPGAKPN